MAGSIPWPFIVIAINVPIIPGPIGFGGTVPPAPTPKPMKAISETAPIANAVGISPKIIPTPKARIIQRFV